MNKIRISIFLSAVALMGALSINAQAQALTISGTIDSGTGALAALVAPGTSFSGGLDWSGTLDGGQVVLGGFCFTDDASGLPPASGTCGAGSAVPILTTGQAIYDGTPAAPGATFQQAGSTFDGTSGVIKIITYSPTFGVLIPIDLTFNGDGTGTVFADAGALGTATGSGSFVVPSSPPSGGGGNSGLVIPNDPPKIPTMPLYGLGLTILGLLSIAGRRLRKIGLK